MKITIELDQATSQTLETLTKALLWLADSQATIAGRYTGGKKAPEAATVPAPTNNPPKAEKPEIEAESSPKIDFAARVPKKEPVKAEPVKVEEPAEAPKTATEGEKTYTLADIQKTVVNLAAQGKKDEVKKIVNKYATKVSYIPADKYVEVMEDLEGLLLDTYVETMTDGQ